jgi:membrane-anchored protein YejM (alkaline phosphatase superfamily)
VVPPAEVWTGDHGEEFMEKGRWGHNSTFSQEQTLVPLVLWVPGQSPRQVDTITSHLDIPATLMDLLGVANSPLEYSQGTDLLGSQQRYYTVISGWDNVAYVDNEDKAIFPMKTLCSARKALFSMRNLQL